MAASGELFLHIARIKTSVVQEPSSYVFPLVPRAATSDLPGEQTYSQEEAILYWERLEENDNEVGEPPAKCVRGRPNVSKYIKDRITLVSDRLTKVSAPLPPKLTPGLTCHSFRRGSAAYANVSPQLAIQWISTRVAWLLDSLTKAFVYVSAPTRENQSVGKVLAGYTDPHLPCVTPSVTTLKELLPGLEYAQLLTLRGQLFKNVSGFTDSSLNVDTAVLDAALLFCLQDVATAGPQEQAATGLTSHYLYRFHEALDTMNAALGARLLLDTCTNWGRQLRTAWETENYVQLGQRAGGDTTVLAAAVTQILASMASMQRTLQKLVAMQEASPSRTVPHQYAAVQQNPAHCHAPTSSSRRIRWRVACMTDLKACINIIIIAGSRDVDVPSAPLERDGVAHQL
ncbi:hypothetical protein PC118_g20635 [Phytophthora cactorum]|uniref:Uncharacterized protein n=1 Tax=Phytophthora cactorum TaxID=29920 RepID=A0A8T0YL66_9STRA|nr:hypothetical protein PC111_g20284 [Phytophthora cactorum]KAG2832544.1 hypothetical protein PC113_g20720 [Phytophthora cactorum]KAG2878602.1 hypothetical protein PC114_g23016 [Phytophthora cactorum]KAG2949649.1 hypothetical protein PC117_g5049 [Phytophthora cactorum]KAG2963894.1 hypothetical protein PC118_g20635 [Phytophthora cactorum]